MRSPYARRRRARAGVALGLITCLIAIVLGVRQAATPHLLSPEGIAHQVAATYGDTHPHIVRVVPDTTDNPPHDPMYTITVAGYFRSGRLHARYLVISALADKHFVFGINAYRRLGEARPVWFDPGQEK